MAHAMEFDVFGRCILAVREDQRWTLFYQGAEGKRRLVTDLVVPSSVGEDEIEGYLADLCHEWATEKHPEVWRIKRSSTRE